VSAMKQRYERGLRPWPGQQADQSETESVTERAAPTPQRNHPHQQTLFAGDSSVLFAAFDAFMQDDDDDQWIGGAE
jgi:hypothetical protein